MCSSRRPRILQMHTTVCESLSAEVGGSIVCTPIGNEPIQYTWYDSNNAVISPRNDRNEMHNLDPGDYYVVATDAGGDEAKVKLRVRSGQLLSVVGYTTTDASSQVSRDGRVEAILSEDHPNVRYMWTNGSLTDTPTLLDARVGTYAVVLVSKDGNPIPYIHAVRPAVVGIVPPADGNRKKII
jgi:hypothetical protein